MTAVAVVVGLLLAALMQVTLAPLFPLDGAVADVVLLALAMLAMTAGPRAAMAALPALCLAASFTSDRSPGLLIIGYLPLLPLATVLEEAALPMNRFLRLLTAVVITGLWARLVLAGGAFAQGADFAPAALIRDILIPGVALDGLLLSLLYLPSRLMGWTPQSLTLRRTGWFA